MNEKTKAAFYASIYGVDEDDEQDSLLHYGVLGMKWGIRRYQPYRKNDGVKIKSKGKFLGLPRPSQLLRKIRSERESRRVERLDRRTEKRLERQANRKARMDAKATKAEARAVKQAEKEIAYKRKLFEKGDVEKIMKNRHMFTTEELRLIKERTDAFAALNKNRPVKEIKTPTAEEAKQWIKRNMADIADITKSAATIGESLMKVDKAAKYFSGRRENESSSSSSSSNNSNSSSNSGSSRNSSSNSSSGSNSSGSNSNSSNSGSSNSASSGIRSLGIPTSGLGSGARGSNNRGQGSGLHITSIGGISGITSSHSPGSSRETSSGGGITGRTGGGGTNPFASSPTRSNPSNVNYSSQNPTVSRSTDTSGPAGRPRFIDSNWSHSAFSTSSSSATNSSSSSAGSSWASSHPNVWNTSVNNLSGSSRSNLTSSETADILRALRGGS